MAAVTHEPIQLPLHFQEIKDPAQPPMTSRLETTAARARARPPRPSLHHLQGDGAAPPGDGLQQDAIGLACAEHEAEVPGLGDGQGEAMPGHQTAAQEALWVGHFWGGR